MIYQKGNLHHTFESQPRLCPNPIQHNLQQNTLFLNQAEEFTDEQDQNEIHKKTKNKKEEKTVDWLKHLCRYMLT